MIESTASLEHIQQSRDARLQFQASFAALEEKHYQEKKIAVAAWLSAADSEEDQVAFSTMRQSIPDTGRWILEEPTVKAWVDPSQTSVPMAWLNGKPGAGTSSSSLLVTLFCGGYGLNLWIGKTILASVLIEECLQIMQSSKHFSLAYFYCRDQDGQRNKFISVAKAMLAQLLRQNPTIMPYLYEECLGSSKITLTSAPDCIKILGTVLQAVPKTFIVIDGIDECEQKERKAILNFFASAINNDEITPGKLRCLFISQELGDINTALHMVNSIRLTKEHSERDIKTFAIQGALKIQERFKLMPDKARDYVVKLVCDGAEGMFLFARLVLENLHDQENLEDVYKELRPDTFPNGFDQA